ncbi:S-methyl-5-thioribose-1-phosphate isomerase, partial [Gordonibacter urolithinfaciens]
LEELGPVADEVAAARPTAVNLAWGVRRAVARARRAVASGAPSALVADELFDEVKHMEAEDEAVNRAIGAHGAELLAPGSRILTHCNAGSLGTAFYGTALGIVYAAAAQGKVERVYADETRPVGQGARLTAWELSRANVPCTLICDDMAASLMAAGRVDAVLVGADRIAANGDAANKIGTYGVAVLARHHGIPFYMAAPTSTIDPTLPDGSGIPIEERDPAEVLPQPLPGVEVWNPAFDVTPAALITRIVTERGVFEPGKLVY